MGCNHTFMPTTSRFMVTVMSATSQGFPRWSWRALTTSTNGWNRVAYNSIQTNRKSFGSQPAVVVTSAHLRLGNDWILSSSSVRHLGVFLDSVLTMHAHVGRITRVCFMMLRQIRAVAAYLPSFATRTLVTSLVLSKLDYCNSVMVGLSKTLTRRLQSVVNADARLVMRKHKYDHITPILSEFHSLGIERRIEFKVALLVFKCSKRWLPRILHRKWLASVTWLVENDLDLDHLLRRSSSFRSGDSNVLGTGRLRLLAQGSGTNFHLRSHPQQPFKALESLSRRIYTVALRSCDSDLRHHRDCLIWIEWSLPL